MYLSSTTQILQHDPTWFNASSFTSNVSMLWKTYKMYIDKYLLKSDYTYYCETRSLFGLLGSIHITSISLAVAVGK